VNNSKFGMKRGEMTGMAELTTLIGPIFMPMKKGSPGGDKQGRRQNDDEARSLHQGTLRHTLQS
jgi:hypothetical protein